MAGLSISPAIVRAEVIDIAANGEVTTHRGPEVFTREGVVAVPLPDGLATEELIQAPAQITAQIALAARRHDIRADLLDAVAWQESRYALRAVSPAGAVGVMQLMGGAAREVGVDRFDPSQNIDGGAAYLKKMLNAFKGDVALALAAYNAGPDAVRRYGGIPPFPETRAYVAAILRRLNGSIAPQQGRL